MRDPRESWSPEERNQDTLLRTVRVIEAEQGWNFLSIFLLRQLLEATGQVLSREAYEEAMSLLKRMIDNQNINDIDDVIRLIKSGLDK